MATVIVSLHRGSALVSKLIQWQTRSPYSHAGLFLPDGRFLEAREGKGVRVLPSLGRANGEVVELCKVEVTSEQASRIYDFAWKQVGKPYDWTMVARFVSRRQEARHSRQKWFCSELVFAAFHHADVELLRATQPWEVSPGLLARSPLLLPFSR